MLLTKKISDGISNHNSQSSMFIQEKLLWPFILLGIPQRSNDRKCIWTFSYIYLFRPIDGISTYNVVPFEAGAYFNKIQCFCFEEQRLNPGEEVGSWNCNILNIAILLCYFQVDMPVFFYIDPDIEKDPFLQECNEITLSYTFFESKPGLTLPTYNPSVLNR